MNRKVLSLQSRKKSPRKVPPLEGLWIALTKNAPPKRTVGQVRLTIEQNMQPKSFVCRDVRSISGGHYETGS